MVFSDGETNDVSEQLSRDFARKPRTETVFVHVWGGDERIYESGVVEQAYEPDSESGRRFSARRTSSRGVSSERARPLQSQPK